MPLLRFPVAVAMVLIITAQCAGQSNANTPARCETDSDCDYVGCNDKPFWHCGSSSPKCTYYYEDHPSCTAENAPSFAASSWTWCKHGNLFYSCANRGNSSILASSPNASAACFPPTLWTGFDKKVCGACAALVNVRDNGGDCSTFCARQGLGCVQAWDDIDNEECSFDAPKLSCFHSFAGGTSDAICECGSSGFTESSFACGGAAQLRYEDGRGCPYRSDCGAGCCLSEYDGWCSDNFEEGFVCQNNACGDDDCCVPGARSGAIMGGVIGGATFVLIILGVACACSGFSPRLSESFSCCRWWSIKWSDVGGGVAAAAAAENIVRL